MPWYRADLLVYTDETSEEVVGQELTELVDFEGFHVRDISVYEVTHFGD